MKTGCRWPMLLCAVLLAGCSVSTPEPVETVKPKIHARNVIFIVVDALRADHVGALGYSRETTPNLDRMAERGLLFSRAYSSTSWTLPSLASYMTSLYPSVHGVIRPPGDPDPTALPERFVTLAESLRASGLQTAAITSQPWLQETTGVTQAFNEHGTIYHGEHLHEELVRVPLIVYAPEELLPAGRVDAVVELIDIYPTIHELLGLEVIAEIQGQSLVPLSRGAAGDGVAFAEGFGFKVISENWSSFHEYGPRLHLGEGIHIRTLYDLNVDPLEQESVLYRQLEAARLHAGLARGLWIGIGEIADRYAAAPTEAELSPEQRARLKSLGYL